MDTHIAPAPDFEEHGIDHGIPLSARLPGEPDPDAEHGVDALAADELRAMPSSHPSPKTNRTRLLGGAAVAGVLVIAGGIFLLSPYNQIVPMPAGVAGAIHRVGKAADPDASKLLAPAASLAGVSLPERPSSIVLPRYTPPPHGQDLAELLAIRPGSAAVGRNSAQMSSQKSLKAAQGTETFAAREPGSSIAAPVSPSLPSPPEATHNPKTVTPATLPQANSTDPVSAPAQKPSAEQTSAAAPHQETGAADITAASTVAPANMPSEAIKRALRLQAGPMSAAEEVKVLELVTQLATIVRDLKLQNATLRADFAKATEDDQARLADFARRIDMAEATNAVAAAKGAGDISTVPNPPAQNRVAVREAIALSPVAITRPDVALPSAAPDAAKRFRVQAASPGLALLTEIARGGGDGAQIQVTVGDIIPGWGKVKSVAQRGTAWVVRTEHGVIE